MIPVNIVVEGITDEPVAKRLLNHVGLEVGTVYGRKGKAHLLERLTTYNKAAQFAPWFAIVDFDMSNDCIAQVVGQWLPNPSEGMRFRVAVRAIEAWLLADRERMADFLAVAPSKIQHHVDLYPNPKETLINIARTSRDKSVREDIVPRHMSGGQIGPLYVARLTEFTEKHWRPDIAANHSESLQRCISALSTLTSWHPQGHNL